mmetsp:Transcript_24974/g.74189  ORF Transcript_24974/g.74189 Transcript_24974/m.74189 type:complete len:204 (-) Transcript_24974:94-705(-)
MLLPVGPIWLPLTSKDVSTSLPCSASAIAAAPLSRMKLLWRFRLVKTASGGSGYISAAPWLLSRLRLGYSLGVLSAGLGQWQQRPPLRLVGGEGLLDQVANLEDAEESPAESRHHRHRRPAECADDGEWQRGGVKDEEARGVPRVRERDGRVVDALAQHPDALEQHLALLLAHPNLPPRLRQLPQPREHVLRLVDDRVEGKHL